MKSTEVFGSMSAVSGLQRGRVDSLLESGEILVILDGSEGQRLLCDFLQTAENGQLALAPGDRVLIQPPESMDTNGCVLGKIGVYRAPETRRLVLTADEEVSIQCGKGSITMRETGQVLIKGEEIVSHAKGNHRIRGGSIELN